jgi:hypothetical protein
MQFENIDHIQLLCGAAAMGGLALSPHTDQKFPADDRSWTRHKILWDISG